MEQDIFPFKNEGGLCKRKLVRGEHKTRFENAEQVLRNAMPNTPQLSAAIETARITIFACEPERMGCRTCPLGKSAFEI